MPYRDQTGPWGYGPGTGRGFGPCGLRRRFRPWTKEEELKALKEEQKLTEEELEEIKERIKELEKNDA
jgi:hypothetical protein